MEAGDLAAVTALVHRYAELLDGGDLDGVTQLFARAVWRSGGHELRTLEQVRRSYAGVVLYDGVPRTKHVITNVTVEVATDRSSAAARSYFTVLQALPDLPLQPIIAGRYHDRFARDAGGWYFTEREIIVDLTGDLSRHYPAGAG